MISWILRLFRKINLTKVLLELQQNYIGRNLCVLFGVICVTTFSSRKEDYMTSKLFTPRLIRMEIVCHFVISLFSTWNFTRRRDPVQILYSGTHWRRQTQDNNFMSPPRHRYRTKLTSFTHHRHFATQMQ